MGLSRNIFYASQKATPERLNTQGILIGQKTVVEISGTLCFCFILCHEKFGCSVFYWLYEKGHFVSIACMAGIIRREIGLKRSLLTWFLVAFLSSCSATIEYHPFVGDEQVLKGSGGACDIVNGVEIWIKGAPSKPFTVIGYIDGQYTEDIGAVINILPYSGMQIYLYPKIYSSVLLTFPMIIPIMYPMKWSD